MLHVGQNEDITYNPKHNNLTRKHGSWWGYNAVVILPT